MCTPKTFIEIETSSFSRHFRHWMRRKLSYWQLSVKPVTKLSSKRQHFPFIISLTFLSGPGRFVLSHTQIVYNWSVMTLSKAQAATVMPMAEKCLIASMSATETEGPIGGWTTIRKMNSWIMAGNHETWQHLSYMFFPFQARWLWRSRGRLIFGEYRPDSLSDVDRRSDTTFVIYFF